MVLACLACACDDDDEKPVPSDASVAGDASVPGVDGSTPGGDAAAPTGDASAAVSSLPRPGALERPPSSLPAELKPPR